MGTWGTGPFDDDVAADWAGDLDDADPPRRPDMLRNALEEVANSAGYLEAPAGAVGVAAAAVVAHVRSGGQGFESAYAPEFLSTGDGIDLPEGIDKLARLALDRVVADDSEWRELWEESGQLTEAQSLIDNLRGALRR
jgi:hypothetical protein